MNWIRKKEAANGLVVKTFNDEYVKFLELAIVYGKPFLFYLLPVQSHEIFWQHSVDSNLLKSHTKKALFVFL